MDTAEDMREHPAELKIRILEAEFVMARWRARGKPLHDLWDRLERIEQLEESKR